MLQVSLFGQFEVLQNGERLTIPTRNAQALLAYLVLNAGRAQRREWLAGLLWPDSSEENARSNLRHELWRLRKSLNAGDCFLVDDLTVTFDAGSDFALDVQNVENAPLHGEDADALMAALARYRGPLLPGFYHDWVLVERERLQALFEVRVARLLDLLQAAGRWAEMQEWATRWIALSEGWPEAAYRAVIVAHAGGGDVSRAVLAYERLAQGMERDLGLQPSQQTREVLARLQAGWRPQPVAAGAPLPQHSVPIPSTRPPRSTVPRPLTSFVGREREIERVRRMVSESRLTTITGPGGVGKTRLAIEVAASLAPHFADGVVWVPLAALPPGEDLVAQTIARALRVPETPGVALLDALSEHLRDARTLLALDNCEHLIADCAAAVERLLGECVQLTVLATSREPLGVSGEKAWLLPSLSLPAHQPGAAIVAYSSVAQAEAVCLFVERAAEARRGYDPAGDAGAVAQICLRLDGIPLAIELAAARMKMMTAAEIAARLDSRFSLLTGGRRTALPQHQTLQAAIEWSYDLLSVAEQRLFRRLAVFAGSFTLEAAEVVCALDGMAQENGGANLLVNEAVLDVLGRLLDKSLLQVAAGLQHSDLATRYRFLETIQHFARLKLDEAGESEQMEARHARYYVRLLETVEPRLLSKEQGRYYRLLQAEADNIRAVVAWAAHGALPDRAESGLRIAGALLWFWWSHSSAREGLELTLKVLALPPVAGLEKLRARTLNTAGYLYWVLGEPALAGQCIEQALAILEQANDDGTRAWSLQFLGLVLSTEGQYEAAHEAMHEGLALAQKLGDLNKSSFSLAFRGDVALQQGDRASARRIYEECAAHLQELGNTLFKAYPLRRLGYLALERNELREAWSYFHESLTLNQEGGDRRAVLACVTAMATLALRMEQPLAAARLLGVVESGLESLSLNLLSLDQIELQRVRQTLQSSLQQAAFQATYAEGWDMGEEGAAYLVDEGFAGG